MILQELVRYYERASAAEGATIAPIGLEWKEISFAIVIDSNGKFIGIEDLRKEDKKRRGKKVLVPQGIKRAAQVESQPLWDKLSYALGYEPASIESGKQKSRSALMEFDAFVKKTRKISTECGDVPDLSSMLCFLEKRDLSEIAKDALWEEVVESTGNLSFRVQGNPELVCENAKVLEFFKSGNTSDEKENTAQCLVTGNPDRIARVHPSIKGIMGAQSSGASIVSFNQNSFTSFGREQGANAPISTFAATAYTTALNSLLEMGSKQHLVIGDTTIVFWSEQKTDFENSLFELFSEPPKDNPAAYVESVKAFYSAPHTGISSKSTGDIRFFILGLGPNASRVVIRFWHAATIREISDNIKKYFSDIDVVKPGWLPEFPTLSQLLASTALRGERKNIQPMLPAALIKAILEGTPFPNSLASSIIRRLKAEARDNSPPATKQMYMRVALLKAYLNRQAQFRSNTTEDRMTVQLDEQNKNIGYNLGRLFAVLEKIQADALGDVNATIRDRFYGAASATPVTCFPRLMRLKNHHLAKLANKGLAITHERKISDIISNITSSFPAHLSMDDQGRFAIGYYHQRQIFFTKKDKSQEDQNG